MIRLICIVLIVSLSLASCANTTMPCPEIKIDFCPVH